MAIILYIKTMSGGSFPLEIKPSTTVRALKTQIERLEGIFASDFTIIYNGKSLQNSYTIGDYRLRNNDLVQCGYKQLGGMQVFIKSLGGFCTAIDILETDTVTTLKKKIFEQKAIPVEEQRLLFSGKQLEETGNRTLKDYKIRADSAIHLVLRLRGGY